MKGKKRDGPHANKLPGGQSQWAAAFWAPARSGCKHHGGGIVAGRSPPPAKQEGEEAPRRRKRRCVRVQQPLLDLVVKWSVTTDIYI